VLHGVREPAWILTIAPANSRGEKGEPKAYRESSTRLDAVHTTVYTLKVKASKAIAVICDCIDNDRAEIKDHFLLRMSQRGMFWPDVMAIILDEPSLRTGGDDEFGPERWFMAADAPDGLPIELLCAIDDAEPLSVLITIYWED
jgi:hypothetical protein